MTTRHDHTQLLSAGSLKGTKVVNAGGEDLGSIEELMLDVGTGEVAYAVLSFGGFLGLGDKLFPVPWQALSVDTVNEQIVFDVPRERLENAPGFDKGDWPTTADSAYLSSIHDYYGYEYPSRRR